MISRNWTARLASATPNVQTCCSEQPKSRPAVQLRLHFQCPQQNTLRGTFVQVDCFQFNYQQSGYSVFEFNVPCLEQTFYYNQKTRTDVLYRQINIFQKTFQNKNVLENPALNVSRVGIYTRNAYTCTNENISFINEKKRPLY